MIRECSLEDISDGRTYGLNDMVKADTGGCQGCFKCCTGMGCSIVLDPYDVWKLRVYLTVGSNANMQAADERTVEVGNISVMSFESLLESGKIELNMVDGLILPNLKMDENDRCTFLDDVGRCTIHAARPGICRLFPLGRVYDGNGGFSYFLQTRECIKENRAKVKVKKWIDAACTEKNQQFVATWHYFIRDVGQCMQEYKRNGQGDKLHDIAMYILNEFFVADLIYIADSGQTENMALILGDDMAVYDVLFRKIEVARNNLENMWK